MLALAKGIERKGWRLWGVCVCVWGVVNWYLIVGGAGRAEGREGGGFLKHKSVVVVLLLPLAFAALFIPLPSFMGIQL